MLVQSLSALEALHEFINKHEEITIDIESTGLNCRTDTIIGFGLSALNNAFYLPIYGYNVGSNALVPDFGAGDVASKVLRALIGKKLRTWNGAFDLAFIRNTLGIDLVPYLHIWGQYQARTR